MKRPLLLCAGVLLAGGAGVWVFGGFGDSHIFRSPQDVEALRAALDDRGAWDAIRRLTARYALGRVVATYRDGAISHHFDFIHPSGLSEKFYRVTFECTETDAGYAVRSVDEGFFYLDKAPGDFVLRGAIGGEVLRALLHDEGTPESPGVYPVLLRCLATHVIHSVHVRRSGEARSDSETLAYEIEVRTRDRQTDEPSSLWFTAAYDTVTGEVGNIRAVER